MTLHIGDNRITSDEVPAIAERRENTREQISHGGPEFYWTVAGHRGALDRNGAITALTIAEELARPQPDTLLIESLRSELR